MTRLETERLLLRPPELRDTAAITRWISDYDVSKNLATAPHPYSEDDARRFVARVTEQIARGKAHVFAIVRKDDWRLIGCTGLHLEEDRNEIGYWLGKPYWNRGYATEALKRLLAFAFRELRLACVTAGWFYDNPASGRVLEKAGFLPGGTEIRACVARGHDVDCRVATLTRHDFDCRTRTAPLRVTPAGKRDRTAAR